MKIITNRSSLQEAILELEQRKNTQWYLLKTEICTVQDGLNPINIITSTIKNVIGSPTAENSLLGAAMGITAGYLSKALIIGGTHNPIKKLFGVIMQWKVTNAVSAKSTLIQSAAGTLLHFLEKRKQEPVPSRHIK